MFLRPQDRAESPGNTDGKRTSVQTFLTSESIFRSTGERARFLTGVLSWLTANIAFFDPPQEDEIFDVAPEHILPGRSRKAFGELGLALRLAHRVPELTARGEVRMLTEAWLAMAHRRNIFFDARRRVHLVPLMAVALAVLAVLDEAPEAALQALRTVLERQFIDRTERSAWSQIDIGYYLDAVGLQHALPDATTLFGRSSLPDLPALPYAQRLDLYAVTHLIFHLSDFGAGGISGATQSHLAEIRDYVALAVATCLAEKDFDLVGEFLTARICLGDEPDALSHFASDALLQAQQPGGFIPDLSWLAGLKEVEDTRERTTAEFFAVYHPTLVALIALACDMARPGAVT
jgi:hypothetical protein